MLPPPTPARVPCNEPVARALGTGLLALALCAASCGPSGSETPEGHGDAAETLEATAPESEVGSGAEPEAPALNEQAPSTHERKLFGFEPTITPAPEGTAAGSPATLRGVARIVGTIPEQKVFSTSHLAGCREHGEIASEVVMAKQTGELANVVVHIKTGIDRASVPPPPSDPVVIEQQGCVFRPHVAVVRADQPLRIENGDSTAHNVNARPAHGSNAAFNKTQPPGGAAIETTFRRAEVAVPLGCDIHPWMKGYVAVVDHPYWSLSDEDGAWSIEVPPGEYLIEAWHERFGTLKGTAKVAAGEVADFEFTFELPKRKR